jgi:hypothetical protein
MLIVFLGLFKFLSRNATIKFSSDFSLPSSVFRIL